MDTILIERSPAPSKLEVLGVDTWPCRNLEPGDHTRLYTLGEECCLICGKAVLHQEAEEPLAAQRGDLLLIPSGSKVRWEVIQPVTYQFRPLEPVNI